MFSLALFYEGRKCVFLWVQCSLEELEEVSGPETKDYQLKHHCVVPQRLDLLVDATFGKFCVHQFPHLSSKNHSIYLIGL